MIKQRKRYGLYGPMILVGVGLMLSACAAAPDTATDKTSSDTSSPGDGGQAVGSGQPAGPRSGEGGSATQTKTDPEAVNKTVTSAETELKAASPLGQTTDLSEAKIRVEFQKAMVDFRSTPDGSLVETIATSDDGSYIVGKANELGVAQIALLCEGDQPGNIFVTDNADHSEVDWVAIVDRLVPAFVSASGCERAILGSPTDCLELPDDPAACLPGEGQGQ